MGSQMGSGPMVRKLEIGKLLPIHGLQPYRIRSLHNCTRFSALKSNSRAVARPAGVPPRFQVQGHFLIRQDSSLEH